jgi:hypothetical protein
MVKKLFPIVSVFLFSLAYHLCHGSNMQKGHVSKTTNVLSEQSVIEPTSSFHYLSSWKTRGKHLYRWAFQHPLRKLIRQPLSRHHSFLATQLGKESAMESIDKSSGSSFCTSREECVKPVYSFDRRIMSVDELLLDFPEHSAEFSEMQICTLMHSQDQAALASRVSSLHEVAQHGPSMPLFTPKHSDALSSST